MKTLILFLVIGNLAFGQEKQEVKTPEERANHLTSMMTTSLALTIDQTTRIGEINKSISQKNEEIRQSRHYNEQKKQELIQLNEEVRKERFKDILSVKQYANYEKSEQEFREIELEMKP